MILHSTVSWIDLCVNAPLSLPDWPTNDLGFPYSPRWRPSPADVYMWLSCKSGRAGRGWLYTPNLYPGFQTTDVLGKSSFIRNLSITFNFGGSRLYGRDGHLRQLTSLMVSLWRRLRSRSREMAKAGRVNMDRYYQYGKSACRTLPCT